jgi:hypothetical protein
LITIALFFLSALSDRQDLSMLRILPWQSMAEASLAVLMVAFTYEWVVRKESERKTEQQLDRASRNLVSQLRAEAPFWILADPDVIKGALDDAVVARIVRAALERHTGNSSLAAGLHDVTTRLASRYREAWSSYRNTITVRPAAGFTGILAERYYSVDYEVRIDTVLTRDQLVFIVVTSLAEFDRLLADPRYQVRFLFRDADKFPSDSDQVFEVVSASVNGSRLNISRSSLDGRSVITASSSEMADLMGSKVTLSYHYRGLARRRGHVLFVNLVVPTNGANIDFNFRDADMAYANVYDFFVSQRPAEIEYFPDRLSTSRISVRVDDWLFPKSGVVFTWALKSEIRNESTERRADRGRSSKGREPKPPA